jgi:hypothetical protein
VRPQGEIVVGWMGTHSTFDYLRTLFPVFRCLAAAHRFRLCIIGSGVRARRTERQTRCTGTMAWRQEDWRNRFKLPVLWSDRFVCACQAKGRQCL